MKGKNFVLILIAFSVFFISFASANSYVVDIYFTVPDSIYFANERIELKGYLYEANYTDNGTLVSSLTALSSASVNLTIKNISGNVVNDYTLTTDINGTFYSKSNYYTNATEINASSTESTYYIRAEYTDAANTTWFSEVEISVVEETINLIRVSSEKARYYASETVNIEAEAITLVGDRTLYTANVSVNGTLRNSTKTVLQTFNCTTRDNGKCTINLTAPSTSGNYILELNNFKAFGSFDVVPFYFSTYMKDELGKSLKNVFAVGEQARVEVRVANASTSDIYTFSGYIADPDGNVVKSINSTTLNSNNSFTNTYLFTVDALTFSYGAYTASITVAKTGDGSITSSTMFEVEDWILSIDKKTTESGFEHEYSVFPNKTIRFEASPTYRVNGSLIENITPASFTINIKDNLNNIISIGNSTWNASCGNDGCYEISLVSPSNTGTYTLSVTLSNSGSTQTETRIINVINGIMSAQSTNKDGALKELFGTNEYAYLSLTAYNSTISSFNLTDAEIFVVIYMNGSDSSYTEVNNFDLVNSSNSAYEWAWNSTLQRLKLDVPKFGGIYNVFILGNNRTIGATAKFIVNPYDVCMVPKDTPGQVDSQSYYYVWQFKTTDTIYFEIKATQANNPLGRATASNFSNDSGTHGMGSACYVDTSTQQVVSNATITVLEVKNTESGAIQNLNITESTCKADDNQGAYTCTVKPLDKWEGGGNLVKFSVKGQGGTTDISYGRFEARAFYLYGWSQTWQNNPSGNITLNVRLYEPGRSWWSSWGSSGGLSGTITVKKVEYQGRDGEWLWPPVDSGYNVSNLSASSVTSGTGTISLPVTYAPGGAWKTGYYRVIIQGTTSDGDTDYGYAWFGVKLWDVYGQPVECDASSCQYKSYFNSKENITLYTKISKAGAYSYSYSGGENIYGNVTIGVKKIEDCRTWPCKQLNSSQYSASTITVNASSPWYWNADSNSEGEYLLYINTTSGSWGTGWYSVVLDVNGTDTGYAWFNTIAFYVATRPTDENGINYKYSIKNNEPKYFNITTTKSYKGYSASYNASDFVNTTVYDAVLRTWNQETWQQIEYNYPEDINITPVGINGSGLLNITYNNGSWPSGYYNGEITLKNSENESSTSWLWFNVRPFRVSTSTNSYNIDSGQCINITMNIYEPDWRTSTPLYGNYSIAKIYETVWGGYSQTTTTYTNYTPTYFNGSATITICPNGSWGSGSWGGYHSLQIVVQNTSNNNSQTGWVSFRAVPFRVQWGNIAGGTSKLSNANIVVPANLTTFSTGLATTGNLTRIYQWRHDESYNGMQEYAFSVGNCNSNVSGQCTVNGTQNITIYAPSGGWKIGYNYLYTEWIKDDDATSTVQDWSGIYFDAREVYNGYYSNMDANNAWKYYFADNENLTIRIYIRNISYNFVDANITNVQYSLPSDNCWDDWCRTYVDARFSLINTSSGNALPTNQTSNGTAVINIYAPSGGWSRGYYYFRTSVSGGYRTATITGGNVRVKDMVSPNITIVSPVNNQSVTDSTFLMNITTTENSQCYFYLLNYNTLNQWGYCSGWNSTANGTSNSSLTDQTINACNTTLYNYTGTTYYYEYVSNDYFYAYDGSTSVYTFGSTGLTTGGTTHTYTFNTTNKVTGGDLTIQNYGLVAWCYDDDWNSKRELVTIRINSTQSPGLQVIINAPSVGEYFNTSEITFNFTFNKNGTCMYSLNNGTTNYSMSSLSSPNFNATNTSIADGTYTVNAYCNDASGNTNYTEFVNFTIDTTYPLINYTVATPDDYSNLTQNSIDIAVSFTETNFANITFTLNNDTAVVNSTTFISSTTNINWTSLSYTNYTYNVSIYDLAGNFNTTEMRHVNLSAS